LWNEQREAGHSPIRKTITFFASNAINQNSPHIALEVITTVRNQQYVTLRNLKVVALCDLGRIVDALPLLRSVLSLDKPMSGDFVTKQTYCRDVVSKTIFSIFLKYSLITYKEVKEKRKFTFKFYIVLY